MSFIRTFILPHSCLVVFLSSIFSLSAGRHFWRYQHDRWMSTNWWRFSTRKSSWVEQFCLNILWVLIESGIKSSSALKIVIDISAEWISKGGRIKMSSKSENGHRTVDYCFVCKKLSSLKCSNCVKVFYCTVDHQRQDWKRHKYECRPFQVLCFQEILQCN